MSNNLKLKPGTIAKWIVGMPGPDVDGCLVTECHEDGSHEICYKVWGIGDWHEETLPPKKEDGLYPSSPFVGDYPYQNPSKEYLNDLKQEAVRRGLEQFWRKENK